MLIEKFVSVRYISKKYATILYVLILNRRKNFPCEGMPEMFFNIHLRIQENCRFFQDFFPNMRNNELLN